MSSKIDRFLSQKQVWIVISLIGLTLLMRLIGVDNSLLDYASYRQTYTAMIAQNFYEYGLDLTKPRIDIIGIKNISEFPIYPALVAILYHLFGVHEILGRLLSISLAGVSVFFLFNLARRMFNQVVAVYAGLLFAILPMMVFYTRTYMLESLMICLSIISLDRFHKWSVTNRLSNLIIAFFFAAMVFLTKIPTIYLLAPIVIIYYIHFRRFGKAPFLWVSSIVLLFVSLIPAFLWYVYVPRYINPVEGIVGDISSLSNRMFSTEAWALRTYFMVRPDTWRRLFFTRILEYQLTPAAALVLIVATFLIIKTNLRFGWKKLLKKIHFRILEIPGALLILLAWFIGVFVFIICFPVFNSLHEYYQIPILLPGSILVGYAFYWLTQNLNFKRHYQLVALYIFLFGGVLAYSSFRLYNRLQVNTNQMQLALAIEEHTHAQEPIIVLDSLPKPELFYYAKRKGFIIGVFAHGDKLPGIPTDTFTKISIETFNTYKQKSAKVIVIPQNNWPQMANNFLTLLTTRCKKIWPKNNTDLKGIYSTNCNLNN